MSRRWSSSRPREPSPARAWSPRWSASPEDDGTLYVFASYAGAPKNPAWYHNLVAHPEVEVEFGTDRSPPRPPRSPAPSAMRSTQRQKELFPQFAEYEAKTDRVIPVIALVSHWGLETGASREPRPAGRLSQSIAGRH